jgi:hypothetical protein
LRFVPHGFINISRCGQREREIILLGNRIFNRIHFRSRNLAAKKPSQLNFETASPSFPQNALTPASVTLSISPF